MGFEPRIVCLKRYALDGVETKWLELPRSDDVLIVPPADWLPLDVHALAVTSDGLARVELTANRGRPARVPLFNGRTLSFRSAPKLAHGDCVSFGPNVSAMFLAQPLARAETTELEPRLGEGFEARAVYADALEDAGDPLGEAIAMAGVDGAPPQWVLNETRYPLVTLGVTWSHGFADEVSLALLERSVYPSGILRVLSARAFCAIRALSIRIDVARDIESPLDVRLAQFLPPTLREFQIILGQRESPPRTEIDAVLDRVRRRCKHVEASVTIDPMRAEPSAERMYFNLRPPPASFKKTRSD